MSKKILVIDDDPTIIKLVRSLLEEAKYQVTTAVDGQEGLEKVKDNIPDLIILDIKMPKTDGYTFILELKKQEDLKDVPVMMLTVQDAMEDLFRMEGVQDYLTKPIDSKVFLEKVRRCLGS